MRAKLGAILALLIGPFILFMNFKETSEKTKIDKEGVETTAMVLDHVEKRGRKGRVDRELTIGYIADDGKRPLQKNLDVSKELFEKADPTVKVKYLKDDPNQVIIVGEPLGEPMLYAIGGGLLLFGLGGTWYQFIRKPRA